MPNLKTSLLFPVLVLFTALLSCEAQDQNSTIPVSGFDSYWYQNQAELISYELDQDRYGENRKGEAVLIFVTEPFAAKEKVKEDHPDKNDYVNVMKLNFTKKFNTGLYPYSMMTSTFLPINGSPQSLKISSSVQEWCGHTYMEMQNNKKFNLISHSYFQGENRELSIAKNYLEDDFWSLIRINPNSLPIGTHQVIPSFFYFRLKHIVPTSYTCELSKKELGSQTLYQIQYPELGRILKIYYSNEFPYQIEKWEEIDSNKKVQTTGRKKAVLKAPYWQLNHVKDSHYRDSLRLINN